MKHARHPAWRNPVAVLIPVNQHAYEALSLRANRFIVHPVGSEAHTIQARDRCYPLLVKLDFGLLSGRRYIAIGSSCAADIRLPQTGTTISDLHAYIKLDFRTGACILTDVSEKGICYRREGIDADFVTICQASIRVIARTHVRIGQLDFLIRPTILSHSLLSLKRLQNEHILSLYRRYRSLPQGSFPARTDLLDQSS